MRESFSKENPLLQIAWDSTSLGTFKECPYKYYLKIVRGFVPKRESHHLRFGIAYHKGIETYHKARAEGKDHENATHYMVLQSLEFSGERNDEGVFSPWETDMPEKSRPALIRALIWYVDHYKDDHAKTLIRPDGKPAVEVSFRFDLGFKDYLLSGHLDRVAEFNDGLWINDIKTTKSTLSSNYFKQYSPHNQMSLYSCAGEVVFHRPISGVIIDATQLAVTFARFQRGFVPRTPGILSEWLDDTKAWISKAEACVDKMTWPMNDTACNNYGGCTFRGVCSKDPSVRQTFLEADFEVKPWDPLEVRN